jgi:methyl-accepting chemotaxis protein
MGVVETCILYLLLGSVVAVALVLRSEGKSGGARVVTFVAGVFFWPVFAPFLLSPVRSAGAVALPARAAQERLRAALGQVEGLAAEVLRPEVARLRGLVDAMGKMEARVGEMDALLATPEFNRAVATEQLEALSRRGLPPEDPRVQSVQARLRNMERLAAMRERTAAELERVVLQLEEMGSRLQLLKFAGRPDAELVELLQSVATSVEEVTEGLLEAS